MLQSFMYNVNGCDTISGDYKEEWYLVNGLHYLPLERFTDYIKHS